MSPAKKVLRPARVGRPHLFISSGSHVLVLVFQLWRVRVALGVEDGLQEIEGIPSDGSGFLMVSSLGWKLWGMAAVMRGRANF